MVRAVPADENLRDGSEGVAATIGATPLIRLKGPSERTGCDILGKAEFLNPGGSVKDRTALGILRDAMAAGTLKPGGLVVEGTAGNTGIGLDADWQLAWAPHHHRHAGNAERGKEGAAAPAGRRSEAGTGGPLQRCGQLRPCLGTAGG